MIEYTDWQQRVIDEQNALRDNMTKLDAYLTKLDDQEVSDRYAPVWLLRCQLEAMETYDMILSARIALFD